MTTWRTYVPLLATLTDKELRDLRAIAKSHQDMKFFIELDNAADYLLFAHSSRWEYWPDENPRKHTLKCMERYGDDIDANMRRTEEEARYRYQWGSTTCQTCHGAGMVGGSPGTYEDPPEPPEVCDKCLGNTERSSNTDGTDAIDEWGNPAYVEAPICPRCAARNTILYDWNTPLDSVQCSACGWRVGDCEPFNDYEIPECTCHL